ncbi:Hypothetical protein R9X50_00276000 [Acrodontium crateriforme]|uniref:Major facilitator superfamily (MFS) profile domain-containing protein n=1 Tax=Acrodontium crateriforme TaxID=150365 RepID=A0AAQ3RB91_9PEZI|nr:Hypothetical protein R9X50_00276000 [Acrodontium crateriforme]
MATVTAVEESSRHDEIELCAISRPARAARSYLEEFPTERLSELNDSRTIGPDSQDASPKEYPVDARLWLTIVVITSALVLGSLDTNILATAVPAITNEFHTIADIGWYSSAFRLTTCVFQFMFGKLYKLFPVKKVFMASNAIFLFSSLICALASSSSIFIVGRAISGVAFAGILSGINAFNIVPPQRRPMFVGFMCGVESLAIASAPVIGGALTEARGWRWCFWINLPIAGATLLITFFFLPDFGTSNSSAGMGLKEKLYQLDLVSNMILIPALTSLFIALSWAGVKFSWHDGRVAGLLVTFGVLSAAFIYNQYRRGDSAALPPRIFKYRSIMAGFIFSTFINSVLSVLQYYLPIYYQIVRGDSTAKSGYMMIPIIIGDSTGAILHGLGTSISGYYTPFMLLSSICAPVFAGLITTFNPTTRFLNLVLFTGAAGFSTGIGFMGSMSAARTVLSSDDASTGTAIMLFGSSFGPAVFIPIAHVILTNQLSTNLKDILPGALGIDVENTGLGELVGSVPPSQRGPVVAEVSKSLSQTWFLAAALGAATIVGSLMMEWRSVKQKKT